MSRCKDKKVLLCLFFSSFCFSCTGCDETEWFYRKISFEGFSKIEHKSEVVIGIIDSGFDPAFLSYFADGSFWKGYDFIDNDSDVTSTANLHGTYMSLLIGGKENNGFHGIDDKLKIVPIRAISDDGSTTTDILLKSLSYAKERGCNVINMSLGSAVKSDSLETMINSFPEDAVFVSSVGDTSRDEFFYPARFDRVLAVSAVNESNQDFCFTNVSNTKKCVRCPGVDVTVPTIDLEGKMTTEQVSGSSYATAIMSGLIASSMGKNGLNRTAIDSLDIYGENGFVDCAKLMK